MKTLKAITLSGGGARAAYEAGVLRAVAEIGKFKTCPFDIITGVSAGAINGVSLATHAEDFQYATHNLWNLWSQVRTEDVFRTDVLTLAGTGARWMLETSLGNWIGGSGVTHLLDTAPLRSFLEARIDAGAIARNIRDGVIRGLSLSATDYETGKFVTFFDGAPAIEPWDEIDGLGVRVGLGVEHVMASAAIPIFFPPIKVGGVEYGDGSVALRSPLSDAIHLGAERIFVVGLQYSPPTRPVGTTARRPVALGDIVGTVLNSIFLNALDADVARLEQTNRTITALTEGKISQLPAGYRVIPSLVVQPSADLGEIDADQFAKLPYPLRHLLKGLGVTDEKGWDLLSYLAFEKGYVGRLLELGHRDGLARRDDIARFLTD